MFTQHCQAIFSHSLSKFTFQTLVRWVCTFSLFKTCIITLHFTTVFHLTVIHSNREEESNQIQCCSTSHSECSNIYTDILCFPQYNTGKGCPCYSKSQHLYNGKDPNSCFPLVSLAPRRAPGMSLVNANSMIWMNNYEYVRFQSS